MTRPNKFGNRKTIVDGITFASAKEARRYGELKLLERAGYVRDLVLQPRYPIEIEGVKVCTYVADFAMMEAAGKHDGEPVWTLRVEDAKGFKTDVYKIKRKLMKACHGIDVVEV